MTRYAFSGHQARHSPTILGSINFHQRNAEQYRICPSKSGLLQKVRSELVYYAITWHLNLVPRARSGGYFPKMVWQFFCYLMKKIKKGDRVNNSPGKWIVYTSRIICLFSMRRYILLREFISFAGQNNYCLCKWTTWESDFLLRIPNILEKCLWLPFVCLYFCR